MQQQSNKKGKPALQEIKIIRLKNKVMAMGNELCGNYIADNENSSVLTSLVYYFIKDERFVDFTIKSGISKFEPSLDKGILLMGNVGSGKSLIMKIFQKLHVEIFGYISCRRLAQHFSEFGHSVLGVYGNQAVQENVRWNYTHGTAQRKSGGIIYHNKLFDDLGAEGDAAYYGNRLNVMAEIIQDRYETFTKYPELITHFTTNLNPDQIEDNYGTRVLSRLKQMCNFIVLGGKENSTDRR